MNLINYFYHYKDSRGKINTKHECLVKLVFNRSQKLFYMYIIRLFMGKKLFKGCKTSKIIFTSYKDDYGE